MQKVGVFSSLDAGAAEPLGRGAEWRSRSRLRKNTLCVKRARDRSGIAAPSRYYKREARERRTCSSSILHTRSENAAHPHQESSFYARAMRGTVYHSVDTQGARSGGTARHFRDNSFSGVAQLGAGQKILANKGRSDYGKDRNQISGSLF